MFPTVMVFKAWPLLHRVNIHLSTASLSLSSRRTRLSPSFHLHPLPLPSNGVHRSLRQLLAVIARNHTRGYYENDSGRCAFLFSPLSPFFSTRSRSSRLSFLSLLCCNTLSDLETFPPRDREKIRTNFFDVFI